MIPGSQALLIAVFTARQARHRARHLVDDDADRAGRGADHRRPTSRDNYHWSWIFLINVPVGILVVLTCLRTMWHRDAPGRKLPIDAVGLGLLILWVGSLQIFLDLGKNADWFNSTLITTLAIIAAVGCAAWMIWESTEQRPVVDLSLFKDRNFAMGTLAVGLGFGVLFGNLVLLPIWLQTQLGYTATYAGLVAAPSGVVAVILTPVVTRVAQKVDARWIATFSFAMFAVSYFMRADYTTQIDLWALILPIMVQGVAMSCFLLSIIAISLDRIPPEKTPSATGISNFVRITSGAFFASLITTVWDRRETLHQAHLVEAATPVTTQVAQVLAHLESLGMSATQAAAVLTRQVVSQSYLLASDDIFKVSAWICLAMIGVVWLTKRAGVPKGPVAAD